MNAGADRRKHVLVAGLVVAAAMISLGPIVGVVGTVFGLKKSFDGLGATDAARKQEALSTGIAEAMSWTHIGEWTLIAGVVLAAVCGVLLYRQR